MVWDEDKHTTKLYDREIEVKKLPRTGLQKNLYRFLNNKKLNKLNMKELGKHL